MIERKAFLQITKAMILGLRNSLTDPRVKIKQSILKELAEILGVERCVLFKIVCEGINGMVNGSCEIIAGVPVEEYLAQPGDKEPLKVHPDIEATIANGRTLLIKDPLTDPRTAYFRGIIIKKDISQILYVPIYVEENGRVAGVIVIDGIHGKEFDEDEILFCSEVAELISLLVGQESAILQRFRDEIVNKIVPLSGFTRRIRENMRTTLDYIEIIHKETEKIDKMLPKTLEEIF
ncbi:MAG: GAF domain-containing protein [Syntrophorhabdaceae bacterium]|nr:GAF domain-containing protein [Syntrophorhabdaceae bacterium]MDD4197248.1 GAF domain-containing protein [Syntrophorhabdaceae bacterium]